MFISLQPRGRLRSPLAAHRIQIRVQKDTAISCQHLYKSGAKTRGWLHLCPLLAGQVPFSIREQINLRPLLLQKKPTLGLVII